MRQDYKTKKMKKLIKANRCSECGKVLRDQNKSKLCSYHNHKLNEKIRRNRNDKVITHL